MIGVLRDGVIHAALRPGQAGTEVDIVATYRVSRPTAKAVIRALVDDRVLRREISCRRRGNQSRRRGPGPHPNPLELEIRSQIIKRPAAFDSRFRGAD